jgi:hypothetical protein
MEFFVSDKIAKPPMPQFASVYIGSFQDLRMKFQKACQIVQDWDTSIPRMKYNLNHFTPLLERLKAHYSAILRKMNFEDVILSKDGLDMTQRNEGNAELEPSVVFIDRMPITQTDLNQVRSYDYNSGAFSSIFAMEDTVSPSVFKRNVRQDTIYIYLHQIMHKGHGVRYLYLYVNGLVVFATKVNDAGLPEKSSFELIPTERVTQIVVKLRYEAMEDEGRNETGVNIDNFEGRIELKRFRIDVVEKITIPLRTFASETEQASLGQVDLELSILLSYVKRTKLEDFEEYVADNQRFMHVENCWGVQKRWQLANYVEQNSLVTKDQMDKIKQDYININGPNNYCFAVFDRMIDLDNDLIPLCKALTLSVFYADASISEKINILWDTLVFFEKLLEEFYIGENSIESDSIQYFTRVLCSGTWISLPEYAAENVVDYIFYGRIPSVRRALYITPIKTFDITNLMRSALNLIHYSTGQRELNFTKKELLQKVVAFIQKTFGNLPIESEAEIFVTINTNMGLLHYTIPVVLYSPNASVELMMAHQSMRLLVENERTRITKERFDVLLPQCGLFAHIYQLRGFYKGKDKFNTNCFAMINQEYFAACVITNNKDANELFEIYDMWDRSMITKELANDEALVFLAIRPWELMILKLEKLVFL